MRGGKWVCPQGLAISSGPDTRLPDEKGVVVIGLGRLSQRWSFADLHRRRAGAKVNAPIWRASLQPRIFIANDETAAAIVRRDAQA
jgi:hypothetical protein